LFASDVRKDLGLKMSAHEKAASDDDDDEDDDPHIAFIPRASKVKSPAQRSKKKLDPGASSTKYNKTFQASTRLGHSALSCSAHFTDTINGRYDDFVHTQGFASTVQGKGTDIKDHMDALYKLASDPDVRHITEVGVRNVVSSYAFAKAAMERPGKVVYRAHDLEERAANTAMTALMAQCPAVDYKFVAGDDLVVPVEDTDFMLIDTWHTYKQLAAELEKLAPRVRKYLAFHNTVAFADR
jgi:hypothetical protein